MKGTENFKRTIQAYIDQQAICDPMFMECYNNPDKNIDDCVVYLINWVQQQGCQGFADDEIYGQVIHYYTEDDIEVGNPIDCKIVVNRYIELTEQEKEQARRDAIKRAQDEAYAKMKQPIKKTIKPTATTTQPALNLFDL